MRWLVGAVAACSLLSAAGEAAAGDDIRGFALVIGNNQPESENRQLLRHADDDAVGVHRLLEEAGYHSILLARLDDDTQALYPDVKPAGPPSWKAIDKAVSRMRRQIRSARNAGDAAELLIFYSGHGDVVNDEGYVVLEDRRLTRARLHALLARLPGARKHVIVDACKSYYLAFERGGGGRRRPYSASFVATSGEATGGGDVGFILSTSSDRDSHEWERFQGGIFSHEVRSALRGAADADGDGRITYAELGAFLTVANAGIANPKYRPDFAIRPPGGGRDRLSDAVLSWPRSAQSLLIDTPSVGHIYIEDAVGVRLIDAHAGSGQNLSVRLPATRPLFVRTGDDSAEFAVQDAETAVVSDLEQTPVRIVSKGARNLALESLFTRPFDHRAVDAFLRDYGKVVATISNAELPAPDPGGGGGLRRVRTISLAAAITAGVAGMGLGALTFERRMAGEDASHARRIALNGQIQTLRRSSAAMFAVAGLATVAWSAAWLLDDSSDRGRRGRRMTISPSVAPDSIGVVVTVEP